MRWIATCTLAALAACSVLSRGPKTNQLTAQQQRAKWTAPVASASFQKPTTGDGGVVHIEFGMPAKIVLEIANCYAHAHSVIGDRDQVKVTRIDPGAQAVEGVLDITDCTTQHVVAHLRAHFPDGLDVEAAIDTDLGKL